MKKFILIFLIFFPFNGFAANITVCDEGCNYKTILSALNALGNGNHTIIVQNPYTANERVAVNRNGIGVGNELIIKAQDGQIINTQGFTFSNVNYIIIDGFNINGKFGDLYSAGIYISGTSSYITIKNNKIAPTAASRYGILIDTTTPHHCLFINNEIYHDGSTCDEIAIYINGYNHVFEENRIHNWTCDAFRIFGHDNIIRKNIIYNLVEACSCHVDGWQTYGDNNEDSYNIIIERNLMYDCPTAQMFFLTLDAPNPGKRENWVFRNNIFYNVGYVGFAGLPKTKFYNNTFYRCNIKNGDHPLQISESGGEIKNNIFIGCGDNLNKGWYEIQYGASVAADYNYVAKDYPSYGNYPNFTEFHGINGGNPGFIDLMGRNLRLLPSSPAINRGADLTSTGFSNDYDGNNRPAGAWDMGAHEYISEENKPPAAPKNLKIIQ